jgi:hypothetical protein
MIARDICDTGILTVRDSGFQCLNALVDIASAHLTTSPSSKWLACYLVGVDEDRLGVNIVVRPGASV